MKYASVIRTLSLMPVFIFLLTGSPQAQLSTGKLEGTVRDMDTGRPLQGAQVTVRGTRQGNVTNADGYYFILNVPPGRRDIEVSYTGYQTVVVVDQLVLAGQTATVDAVLSSTVIQMEGITVEGVTELLVPRDNTVSKTRLTPERIAETPATVLEDLMIQEAGVQTGGPGAMGRGLRIRGGRLGEELMVVDGVAVRNFTAEPTRDAYSLSTMSPEIGGITQDASPLEFSTNAVEEVDIITGGFQAEYGNAQSGIINIVTKEGGPDFRGNVRFTTDQQNPRTSDYGYNQLRFNVGGPMLVAPNMYFHVSGEIQGEADRVKTHADEGFRGIDQRFVDRLNAAVVNDPVLGQIQSPFTLEKFRIGRESYASRTGNSLALWTAPNPVRLPENWGDRTLVTGKVTHSPIQGTKLIGSWSWSRNQYTVPGGDAGNGNYFQDGVIRKGDQYFDLSPYWAQGYEVITIPQGRGRRTKANNLLLGFDWEAFRGADRSGTLQFRYTRFRSNEINAANLDVNYERDTFMGWSPHDIRFMVEQWPHRENPTALEDRRRYHPNGDAAAVTGFPYETPFQIARWTAYDVNYRYMREWQNNYKADFDLQINRHNRAKLGLQYTGFSNNQFRTRYATGVRASYNEFEYRPKMGAGYVQNRTDLGDFVFDYGLRYDAFNPVDNWGLIAGDPLLENTFPQRIHEWSPRFAVAFPVTDKSQLRFSYGVFSQLPNLNLMFGYNEFGNWWQPGFLEYSRTDAYEAGISNLLSDDIVLDMAAYYRDVQGNPVRRLAFFDYYRHVSEYRVRTWINTVSNRGNGNIKGVDVTIRKRFSDNFSFNLMYTLQFSRTTASSYQEGSSGSYDTSTGEIYSPPDELRPINGDQTHKFTYQFNYLFPEDFQAGTLWNTVLKDFRVYSVYQIQSGVPTGDSFAGENFFRGRWYTNLDLRFAKGLNLGRTKRFQVFAEIFNALNHKEKAPYPKAYRLEPLTHVTAGVDLVWDNLNPLDANRVRFNADFDGDGILTVTEAAMGQMAYNMMMATMDKRNWGYAREIRVGLDFSF